MPASRFRKIVQETGQIPVCNFYVPVSVCRNHPVYTLRVATHALSSLVDALLQVTTSLTLCKASNCSYVHPRHTHWTYRMIFTQRQRASVRGIHWNALIILNSEKWDPQWSHCKSEYLFEKPTSWLPAHTHLCTSVNRVLCKASAATRKFSDFSPIAAAANRLFFPRFSASCGSRNSRKKRVATELGSSSLRPPLFALGL